MAAPGKRHALIIGNTDYAKAMRLPNASADARAMADLLAANGFVVQIHTNLTRRDFARRLTEFARKISIDDTVLFYFAGHGMQMKGENFLLGLDAELESEFDVDAETISLASIIDTLESRAAVALVFIDACRNNPLANRLNAAVSGTTRGETVRGLAPVLSAGSGTMVAFAASPGQVAFDGGGLNSPFTNALVAHLASPNTEIGTAFKRVIREVREKTAGRQSPQIVSNLAIEIYVGPQLAALPDAAGAGDAHEKALSPHAFLATPSSPLAGVAPGAAPMPLAFTAQQAFEKAERIGTVRGWDRFLMLYHGSSFQDQAVAARQRKLAELMRHPIPRRRGR